MRLILTAAIFMAMNSAWAETAYRCKSPDGSTLLSNVPCEQQLATEQRRQELPRLAPPQRSTPSGNYYSQRQDHSDNERAQRCAAIEEQLQRLIKKYESGDYVPVPEVNRDQAQERQLKNALLRSRC